MNQIKKEDYVCAVPFLSLEIHDRSRFLCCASWLKKYLPENTSPSEAWNSKEAVDIRNSILDGSYRYCDSAQCPFLHQLETLGHLGKIAPITKKSELTDSLKQKIQDHKDGVLVPTNIQFSFDRTCNLKCPSCRVEIFAANSKKIKEVQATIDQIQEQYSNTVELLYITGSGDPFISVGFRDFLRNFDRTKWPKVRKIHLHTNATKWNKDMWDSMRNVHPFIRSCEISIDAATKDTYENKTRIGGKWDELIENLHFISSIETLENVKTSFVVQKHNYKEMKLFYDLMVSIFKEKTNVYFGKITNWGTFSKEEFEIHQVWNTNHPEHNQFLNILNKTLPADYSFNNLQEFILPNSKII